MNTTAGTTGAVDPGTIAAAYVAAVGRHDLDAVAELLADDVVARMAAGTSTKQEWLAALRRLLPALQRNELRHVSADGATACVVYDFVTDTPAGSVPCVEVITVSDGLIHGIELIFDRVSFGPVNQALQERAAVTTV
ncbi:MAG TPA: nuclear transport factor 2 family protein [Humibacter sp.]|nr:nuclear transport factor 2 family protein [Humibacter sp.]